MAETASAALSDSGTAGLGYQPSVHTRKTSVAGSTAEEVIYRGVTDPGETEELKKAEAEFVDTFGVHLLPLEETVNVTQAYYLFLQSCAEGNGFQTEHEKATMNAMNQESVTDWLVSKGIARPFSMPHECLRAYLAQLQPVRKGPCSSSNPLELQVYGTVALAFELVWTHPTLK